MQRISYARHQFPAEIIRHTTWLYLRFTLSYRDVEELLAERGIETSYETVADLVPPVAVETAGAIIGGGGGGRPVFGGPGPRYETWPRGCCGLESGDAKAIPVRKLILSRSPAPQREP